MTNISIDYTTKKIIISKNFEKLAKRFGSAESDELKQAIQMYPNFTIKVHSIKTNPSKMTYKGFTYQHMEDYFKANKGADGIKLCEELETLRGRKNGKRDMNLQMHPYGKIKAWFLGKCPEIDENIDAIDLMLQKTKEEAIKRKEKAFALATDASESHTSATILELPESSESSDVSDVS